MADKNVLARALQALEKRRINKKRQPRRLANLLGTAGRQLTKKELERLKQMAKHNLGTRGKKL